MFTIRRPIQAHLALEFSKEAGERLLDAHARLLVIIRLKHVRLQPQQRYSARGNTLLINPGAHHIARSETD